MTESESPGRRRMTERPRSRGTRRETTPIPSTRRPDVLVCVQCRREAKQRALSRDESDAV